MIMLEAFTDLYEELEMLPVGSRKAIIELAHGNNGLIFLDPNELDTARRWLKRHTSDFPDARVIELQITSYLQQIDYLDGKVF